MKKGLIIGLSLLLVLAFASGTMAAYKDGQYVGYVPNDHGDVVLEMVVVDGKIADVNMYNPYKMNYEYEPGKEAYIVWPSRVMKAQSAKVDVITGATHSTEDYTKATQMALDIASGSYKGNKFYGIGPNWEHGHTVVEITVDGNKITDCKLITANPDLLESEDGREKLMPAKPDDYGCKPALQYFKEFPDKVVENQGNVDVVSGATHSGHSYNAALDMAMVQAGLTEE